MHPVEVLHKVSKLLGEFRLDIGGCHITVMAHEAGILLKYLVEKPFGFGRRMGSVAVCTSIFSNGPKIGVRPGVCPQAVPLGIGYRVRT